MSLRALPLLVAFLLPLQAGAAGSDGEGTIAGIVTFRGTPPARKSPSRQGDPFCAKTPAIDESVVIGKRGALRDVVVTLPTGTKFSRIKALPSVVIDQKGCRYAPHVTILRPEQSLKIRNSDGTLHNVHAYDGDETLFNEAQVMGSPALEKKPGGKLGSFLKLACDVHPWMEAFVFLIEHQFARVTDAAGRFALPHVPAGSYELEAWHPVLGQRKARVVVRAGKTSVVNFTYGAP